MANFCPNCGNSVSSTDAFCPNCGAALTGGGQTQQTYVDDTQSASGSNVAGDVMGVLVTATLLNGLTQQLYYRNGMYFMDPYCRRPYRGVGVRRHVAMRPAPRGMAPRGAAPRGGARPMGGGVRGGGARPMGGGPRGGGARPMGGGPRGGGHR